jgi:lipid-binding SYLF domain-containing protein
MLRRNSLLTLLIGLLLAIGSPASAQEKKCPTGAQEKKCPTDAPVKKGDETPRQRQKPHAEYESVEMVPRTLPAVYQEEFNRAVSAAEVISDFTPQGMIEDIKAVAVIPGVKKAAFGFGARWGKGLISRRDEEGAWLPPSFIEITGGNFGFQAGVQSTDLVLIFTNEDAVNALLRGKLTLNADASAAAGPIGRKAQVGVPILINSGIYTYSRSRGLFAGVSLDGAAITIDDTSNHRVYGMGASGDSILIEERVAANEAVAPFLNALETFSPGETAVAEEVVTQE